MDRKRQARAFHRLLTGLQVAQNNKAYMRFMTLTTARTKKRTLTDSFRLLKLRIKRATYERDGFNGFKFSRYYCLRTSEGNGVMHIVYWGLYIPWKWLQKQWIEIHGARGVDVRKVYDKRNKRVGGLVGYLLTNYLSEQPIERMSYGWRWAWLGFCKSWKRVQETYGNLRRWRLPYKEGARATWNDKYKNCSWEAWWSFLYGDRPSLRRLKMSGAKFQRYWEKGFDRTTLDLPKYQPAMLIYGLPKKRLVWVRQTTLFGYNHGFAT